MKRASFRCAAFCLLLAGLLAGLDGVCANPPQALPQDSLIYRNEVFGDGFGNLGRGKMAQSAFPVRIKAQGRALCVRSDYNQVLPVYNSCGSFYSLFRLSKGVNWVNGLPRGTYYINNRKIVIP